MNRSRAVAPLLAALLLATTSSPALGQANPRSAPQAAPIVDTIPAARDVPYPGTVRLDIDASDLDRAVFKVTQTFPVPQGANELVLLLPEWLPGNHAPRGAINLLADLRFDRMRRFAGWRD